MASTAAQPLTIAYCGNFRHAWCTEVHVAGSLRELGHTVIQIQEDELDWADLPTLAAAAHLVLWTRTWEVDIPKALAALAQLREQRIPSVSYHLDRWWGLDREEQVMRQPFFRTDLVVSPDGGNDDRWAEAGVNHLYLPPGVYAAECGTVAPNPRAFPRDVVFVGTHPYPHKEWAPYRTELLDRFRAEFGRRFGVYPQSRGRPVRGLALRQLYATAKVVIGDSCLVGNPRGYFSDRIPETLGRGGLLIHPDVEGLSDWYSIGAVDAISSQDDLLTYTLGEFDDALSLAHWALDHPAEAREVADHGRATVLGRDTYAHRMQTVLDHVEEHFGFGRGPLAPAATARRTPTMLTAAKSASPPELLRVRHRRMNRLTAAFELAAGDPDNLGRPLLTRVLVLSDLYPPFPGGAETLIGNLARRLHRSGATVQVLTGYAHARAGDGPPVRYRDIGIREAHDAGWAIILETLADFRPDVILVHHLYAYEFEAELVATEIPLVQVVLNTRRMAGAALAVFISRYVRDQHDHQPQDLTITPPAFADVVADNHGHCIGFIKPIEHKGVALVYALAEALPQRQFLILRGEWQNIEIIEHLPNVTFMEPVVDISDFYAECRLVLVPSISEDAGTVAQEAAMNGLPCLSSDVGGLPETNAGGVLLATRDVGTWVDAIEALDDPDVYAEVVARQSAALAAMGHGSLLDEFARRVEALGCA